MATGHTGLTPRQREVMELLDKDEKPEAIAKKLGTSTNNIYGHMKRLRKIGALPKSGRRKSRPRAATNGSLGVSTPVIEAVLQAKAEAEKRIAAIDDEAKKLMAEREALAEAIK